MRFTSGLHPYSRLGPMEALEGARILERRLSVVSNSIANTKTPGFKRQRITFHEYLLKQVDNTERTAKGEVVRQDLSQGTFRETKNPFDFAIEGPGFFAIQTPRGIRYTRAGNFTLDAQYRLVTQEGYPVLSDGAPIVLRDTTGKGIWLSSDGRFYVDETDTAGIDVFTFENPQALKRLGGNMWEPTKGSGRPQLAQEARVRQGFIEASNVNTLEAMINLIDLYREYESIQKALKTVDDMDGKAATDVGRVS